MRCVLLLATLLGACSGAKVCFSGYVMDTYCLNLGHLLDNSKVVTLEEPRGIIAFRVDESV